MLKRKKFDYAKKKYANPFFGRVRKASISNRFNFNFENKIKYFIILAIVGLISLVWLFGNWRYFKIDNITVNGVKNIPKDEIEKSIRRQMNERLLFIMPQKNIFFFKKNKAVSMLQAEYNLGNIFIDKDFPRDIIITAEEREYAITWLEDEIYYFIDKNGNIIVEADPLELNQENYPLVENRGAVKIDKKIAPISGRAEIILSIFNSLKDLGGDFKINRFILGDENNKISAKIINGPEIYFNAAGDFDQQINKLPTIVNEKLKNNFLNLEYIDLRYGDKVYYK